MQKQESKTIPPLQKVINFLRKRFKDNAATSGNNHISDRDIHQFRKKIDPEDNKKTSPPSDEQI